MATTYGQTRVNTTTSGNQLEPNVATLSDGGYVIVWTNEGSESIFSQRYNASGVKVGSESVVSTSLSRSHADAVVTGLTSGGYVVAWKANEGSGDDIRLQRFDVNGSKVGGESQVNTYSLYDQDSARVMALADGGFVVNWASWGQDGSDWGGYLQRYDANGAKVGSETRVATSTSGPQDGAVLTHLNDGGYMAVWEGNGSGDTSGIFAQRFSSSWAKVGSETRINTTTTNLQTDAAITTLKNGSYVITWQSQPADNDDDDDTSAPGDIYAQLYSASGTKIGGETRVNTTTSGYQEEARVTALNDGSYVVTWSGNGVGDASGIFLQRFNSSGAKVGAETRINTTTDGNQEFSSITVLADGGYLIAWESYDAFNNPEIFSQRFDASGQKLSGLVGDSAANTLTWTGTNSAIIDGYAGNDSLKGAGANDHLNGGDGNDTLNGGAGADFLAGGAGSDYYYVDNAGDRVIEASGSGTDTVASYLTSYTLGANIENGRILSSGAANLTGNSLANNLTAGAGNNVINGGTGIDTASYASALSGVSINLGITTGQATGGSGSDQLLGIENLLGSQYADSLTGNGAANVLNGGAGADSLVGALGNDTYVIDNSGDRITESSALASEIDTVHSSVSWSLGTNLEKLILTGVNAINGNGNGLANTLTGNTAANVLNGGAGSDTLTGGGGADRFVLDNSATSDLISDFLSGTDKLVLDNSGLGGIGDKDALLEGALLRSAAGAFSSAAELVVFNSNISGSITTASAAAKIGSATSAYAIGDSRIFAVDNGSQTAVYQFKAVDGDAAVESNELKLLGTLGSAQTGIGDYLFQA